MSQSAGGLFFRAPGLREFRRTGMPSPMQVACCRLGLAMRCRAVAESSCVLVDRAVRDVRRDARRMPAIAGVERGSELRPVTIVEFRPPKDFGHCKRSLEDGLRPLAALLALKAGGRRRRSRSKVGYSNEDSQICGPSFWPLRSSASTSTNFLKPRPSVLLSRTTGTTAAGSSSITSASSWSTAIIGAAL
jgi:hypothetical protein